MVPKKIKREIIVRAKRDKKRMVEKAIIANMGEGDVGKTESIIMVYEKLKEVADSEKDQVGTKLREKD